MDELKNDISTQLSDLQMQLKLVSEQIEAERKEETSDDGSSVLQELLDKKDILEKQISGLESDASTLDSEGKAARSAVNKKYVLESNGRTLDIKIVMPSQADPTKGLVSNESPLAKAVVGAKTGQTVKVSTPVGSQSYRVKKVS